MVMYEFNILSDDPTATVFKLVGPILAKQDMAEAKINIKTRLDYITKELERMDHLEKEFTSKVEDKRKHIASV